MPACVDIDIETKKNNVPSLLHHIPTNNHLFKTLEVTPFKTSNCFTQNFYLLAYKLNDAQLRLLIYIIIKADTRNYLQLTTTFIKRYIALQLLSKHETYSIVKLWGSNSYNSVKSDIIFLINAHVLIQLRPNSKDYMLNPLYSYPKIASGLSKFACDFSVEWANKQAKNQLDNDSVRLMAAKYYVVLHKRFREKNKERNHKRKPGLKPTVKDETRRRNELYAYLMDYIEANK